MAHIREQTNHEINLLGCVDQYQVCNPNKPGDSGCTKLGGILSAGHQAYTTEFKSLGFNAPQIMTISRFLDTSIDKSMWSNVFGRGGAALNASLMVMGNLQTSSPSNQWQIEVSNWFAMSLAKEQSSVLEWAAGPKNLPSTGWHINTLNEAVLLSQCYNQLVPRTADYRNFSVLGLIITVVLCGLIVLIGLTIDTVVDWLRREKSKYMREQWEAEETLALQKAAYPNLDLWQDNEEGMPPNFVLLNSSTTAIQLRDRETEEE